jgi:hypothetical protein
MVLFLSMSLRQPLTSLCSCSHALAQCTNTIGSRLCHSCAPGFAGTGLTVGAVPGCSGWFVWPSFVLYLRAKFACLHLPADINECLNNNGNCWASNDGNQLRATCTNTNGSFACACPAGFSGNGVTSCTRELAAPVSLMVVLSHSCRLHRAIACQGQTLA